MTLFCSCTAPIEGSSLCHVQGYVHGIILIAVASKSWFIFILVLFRLVMKQNKHSFLAFFGEKTTDTIELNTTILVYQTH